MEISMRHCFQATAKTLIEEEHAFRDAAANFSPEAMKAAWEDSKMTSIDYSRASDQSSGNFDEFYQKILRDQKFLQEVPQNGVPLLAGAAMQRAVAFFQKLTLEYLYPEQEDADRISNAAALNSDMPFLEDHLNRVYLVGKVKAAKMREVTMYLVRKTAFLMTQAFKYACDNMLKNQEMKSLIEGLNAGNDDVEVFDVLRNGFVTHLLVHAENAYRSSISDHHQSIHQLGAFYKEEDHLFTRGVRPEQANEIDEIFEKALQQAVAQCLPNNFKTEFKKVYEGIQEGLKMVGRGTFRKDFPTLLGLFVSHMKEAKIIAPEILDSKKEAVEEPYARCKTVSRNHQLGMLAVSFAFFGPQFSEAVILRCTSGLLGSLNSSLCKYDYEESMTKELHHHFLQEGLQERLTALEEKKADLEVKFKDLSQASKKLDEFCKMQAWFFAGLFDLHSRHVLMPVTGLGSMPQSWLSWESPMVPTISV